MRNMMLVALDSVNDFVLTFFILNYQIYYVTD